VTEQRVAQQGDGLESGGVSVTRLLQTSTLCDEAAQNSDQSLGLKAHEMRTRKGGPGHDGAVLGRPLDAAWIVDRRSDTVVRKSVQFWRTDCQAKQRRRLL
jgi:hypothetical protein